MRRYMSVTGLRAEKARIDHSEMTWGFPSPTAWAGLANAIGRITTGKDWVMTCLPIIHDQKMRNSNPLPEFDLKGGEFSPQEAKSREQASLEFSVILSLSDEFETPDKESLADAVRRVRISGSPIIMNYEKCVRITTDDGAYLSFEQAAKRTLRRSGLGYMVLPWEDSGHFYRYEDEVHQLLTQIREGAYERENLFPAMIGYSLITEPTYNRGGRNSMKHAFAEPVTGLVEMRLNTRYEDLEQYQTEGFGFSREGEEVLVNKIYHS